MQTPGKDNWYPIGNRQMYMKNWKHIEGVIDILPEGLYQGGFRQNNKYDIQGIDDS